MPDAERDPQVDIGHCQITYRARQSEAGCGKRALAIDHVENSGVSAFDDQAPGKIQRTFVEAHQFACGTDGLPRGLQCCQGRLDLLYGVEHRFTPLQIGLPCTRFRGICRGRKSGLRKYRHGQPGEQALVPGAATERRGDKTAQGQARITRRLRHAHIRDRSGIAPLGDANVGPCAQQVSGYAKIAADRGKGLPSLVP